MPHKFLKNSRHIFLDLDSFIVVGGLDDTQIDLRSYYTNYCYMLTKVSQIKNDNLYICQPKSSMAVGRGNFAICLNNGFIYCFGGDTHNTRFMATSISTNCEKYDISDDQWY